MREFTKEELIKEIESFNNAGVVSTKLIRLQKNLGNEVVGLRVIFDATKFALSGIETHFDRWARNTFTSGQYAITFTYKNFKYC
tara:strand:- start:456 stop:707 length:252 start_codon:yes stop_codon:yes gene_type:complete